MWVLKKGFKIYVRHITLREINTSIFEEEKDVEFDQNDITWAKAFIKGNNCFKMIFDDETA